MKWTHKAFMLAICLCLVFACTLSVCAVETGNAGDNATYTYDYDTRTLTVRGTGTVDRPIRFDPVKIIVEDGITSLSPQTFYPYCGMVESISIAGSVEEIGYMAFGGYNGMQYLTELNLNEGLQSIGADAFERSTGLTSLVLPSTVTWIGAGAFRDGGFTEVTFLGALPEMGDGVFSGVYDENGNRVPLTVYYPDDGSWTQADMKPLDRPTTYIPFALDAQGNRVPDLNRAYTPESPYAGTFEGGGSWHIDNSNVLHISGAANITTNNPKLDEYWSEITGLVVEPGVTTFYHDFSNYEKLTDVTYSDDLKIGPRFFYCYALENVDLGEGLTVLREGTFYVCPNIWRIEIPASVTDIHNAAFYDCHFLERITFYGDRPTFHILDSNRPNIINRMMQNWEIWQQVMGGPPVEIYYPADNSTWTENLEQLVLGSTVEYVPCTWTLHEPTGTDYFEPNYDNATTVLGIVDYWKEIPVSGGSEYDGLSRTLYANGYAYVEIANDAQAQQTDYSIYYGLIGGYNAEQWKNVKHIVIGEGIKGIRELNLSTEITHEVTFNLPSTLTEIEGRVFPGMENYPQSPFTDLKCIQNIDFSSVTKMCPNTFSGCTNLESVILGDGLTEIPEGAFRGTGLKSIQIPNSVTSIGDWAFTGCAQLESVKMGDNVETISAEAFRECVKLSNVELSKNLKNIGPNAFYGDKNLKSIILPEGLDVINADAFYECGLEKITIPDSVTYLGGDFGNEMLGTFACPNLKEVKLGSGIVGIPWGCFGNTPITSLEIPDSVTFIDAYAFASCDQLTSVTIPASVSKIGGMAFVNSVSLTNVIFRGDAPKMESPFFCASFNGAAFYPKGNATWEDNLPQLWLDSGGLLAFIPYTVDDQGNVIPEAPSEREVKDAILGFVSQTYGPGSTYPDNYSYILNGNMLKVYGEEAFAFELSDVCFGYLPISEKRSVSYDALHVGDILYAGSDVWVITQKNASGVELAGVQNGVVCYGVTMTKAQVQAASAYRTRVGVSPYPGKVDPAQGMEKVTGLGHVPTEEEVHDLFIAQQAQFPQGMPYSEKDHYHNNVTWYVAEDTTVSQEGHGCSAFSGYLSDLAFGDLPARYFDIGKVDFDSIMVGDRLFTAAHEMIVLEVYSDCVLVVEGNMVNAPRQGGRICWGRAISRQEIENEYALVTRYPEGTVPAARTAFTCSHKYMDTEWVFAPTCIQEGYTLYPCNSCDYSYADNEIPATGKHRYKNGYCQDCYTTEPPVADRLEELVDSSATAEDIRDAVQNMDSEALKETLMTDSEAEGDLAALEQRTGGAAAVEVKDASLGIDQEDVKIVGANLNELTGAGAVLVISTASKSNAVPEAFDAGTAVHFSMTLENVAEVKQLAVPVVVTLTVPDGLDAGNLVLIHYHDDGVEILQPVIRQSGDKVYATVVLGGFSDFAFAQKAHEHSWKDATCTAPKTCATCGTTSGNALGHSWKDATCTAPKTCKTCGATSGKAKGHNWAEGNCTTPKTCKVCGVKDGEVVHTYDSQYDYKCNVCGKERGVDMTRPMVDMFRMYDPNSGEHFYTGSEEERDNLVAVGWNYEGVGFTFPLTTGLPVHRLYDPATGEHLYTMDENEKATLMAAGWNYEGIAFNSGFENEVPQYRLHNPNATRGAYHFTASAEERDLLLSLGWEYQGIGWYSLGA